MSHTMALSKHDRAILKLLQEDISPARQALAEAAGLSSTTLWRRMNELENQGIIRRKVALVDPEKAGLDVCVLVSINLTSYEPETRAHFERDVDANPHIMECYRVTGGSDYMLTVRTPSVSAFEAILIKDILAHPAVASASSNITLRQTKYTTALPL